jgi:gentisate 1,2-dioxygenase
MTAPDSRPSAERQAFYDRLAPHAMAPLWEVLRNIIPPEPTSRAASHCWSYADVRPLLLESGSLLSAEEAERRVLVLENPALVGQSRITATLYAGIQLVMPGEIAPAHRHTPSALRFMIEGTQGFTVVGGERTEMREGDLIITPSWAWHDHGNEGDSPVAWLDGLDIPVLQFFEGIFLEGHNAQRHETTRPEGDSAARFGSGLLPMDATSPYGMTSPIFNYPYERTREALFAAAQGEATDPHHGTTLRYANPTDGGWAMPTMATWVTLVHAGTSTVPVRSTDGIVAHLIEGSARVTIGPQTYTMLAKDTVAIPGWQWRTIEASSDAVFFCFSDRVIHEKLGFWREERRNP